jgi:hypothetical protein
MTARAQQLGCLVGVTEPAGQPCRQRSLRPPPRVQAESHLGRNRLTSDAPYKAMLPHEVGRTERRPFYSPHPVQEFARLAPGRWAGPSHVNGRVRSANAAERAAEAPHSPPVRSACSNQRRLTALKGSLPMVQPIRQPYPVLCQTLWRQMLRSDSYLLGPPWRTSPSRNTRPRKSQLPPIPV